MHNPNVSKRMSLRGQFLGPFTAASSTFEPTYNFSVMPQEVSCKSSAANVPKVTPLVVSKFECN